MHSKTVALAFLAATISMSSAFAQVSSTKSGYQLRIHFKKGQNVRYEVVSSVLVPNMTTPIDVRGPFFYRVTNVVGSDGILDATFGPLMNKSNELMHKQNLHYRENDLGEIVGARLPQMSVVFPKGPKKPGQTWSAKTSVRSVGSDSVVTAEYRFVGMTVLHQKRVAELSVRLSSTGQTDTKGTGDIYILASDGSMLESRFHISVTAPQGPISTTMTLVRQ